MKKVLLLLAEGFEIYEASVFVDVMGWNHLEGDHNTELFSCGLRKELNSSFGQKFIADYTIDEIDPDTFDALAIPGGFEEYGFYKDAYNKTFSNVINHFTAAGKMVATICVGALPLAKTGMLKGKNATTYNSPKRRQALKDFGANVLHQPIVFEDNIITSWNPSTATAVAFHLLEYLTSVENTKNVQNLMGF
jgi:4-methyl-5(b-hydroxyethyl)-thiazole monophosphate biosynthesis